MPYTIHTEVLIDRAPGAVWQALVDFPGHASWDPLLAAVDGAPVEGSRLTVRFRKGMTFRPRVTEVREAGVLEWLGTLWAGPLFSGRHRFELVPEEGGATRLVHSESFTGLLVPLLRRMLAQTERDFAAFNAALKARVEGRSPSA
jgi:hypothetical protein